MEILTKTDHVFESTDSCLGCGVTLGLKFILQSVENLKNTVLVVSPGEVAELGKSHLRLNVIKSDNPAATAIGIANARPDINVIVYASDGITFSTLSTVLSSEANILYICCNNSLQPGRMKEFVPLVRNASYAATASISYYEDFISKLKKSFLKTGTRFIDLLTPCPSRWGFEPSNTIEMGRMATESYLWPIYEVEKGAVSVTKTPPHNEPVKRILEILKMSLPEDKERDLQDYANRKWKALNDGKLI
ncbi:hypothetical protein HYZ41_04450 [archaeon]|nr:hypothetical protein [archaeon]